MRTTLALLLMLLASKGVLAQASKYYMSPDKQKVILEIAQQQVSNITTDTSGVKGYYLVFTHSRIFGCLFFQKDLLIRMVSFSVKENGKIKKVNIASKYVTISGIDLLFEKNETFFLKMKQNMSCPGFPSDTYDDRYFLFYRDSVITENIHYSNSVLWCNEDFWSTYIDYILYQLSVRPFAKLVGKLSF